MFILFEKLKKGAIIIIIIIIILAKFGVRRQILIFSNFVRQTFENLTNNAIFTMKLVNLTN